MIRASKHLSYDISLRPLFSLSQFVGSSDHTRWLAPYLTSKLQRDRFFSRFYDEDQDCYSLSVGIFRTRLSFRGLPVRISECARQPCKIAVTSECVYILYYSMYDFVFNVFARQTRMLRKTAIQHCTCFAGEEQQSGPVRLHPKHNSCFQGYHSDLLTIQHDMV